VPIPNLADLVARLDGTSCESESLESELNSIALPPLLHNDLAEWLDLDLLRLILTDAEIDLIRRRDSDYVSGIRQQQREHAQKLKSARDSGSLGEAPGVATSAVQRTHRDLTRLHRDQIEERARKERLFCEQIRAEFAHPDAGLYTFLRSTVETFIWRPAAQRCRVWLAEDGSRAEVEQLIGATLNAADDVVLEIAFYRGILYNIFLGDPNPSPRIIYTDHETAWDPGEIYDAGPLNEFLSEYLSVDEAVEVVNRQIEAEARAE
jgi:hypothetical protein